MTNSEILKIAKDTGVELNNSNSDFNQHCRKLNSERLFQNNRTHLKSTIRYIKEGPIRRK